MSSGDPAKLQGSDATRSDRKGALQRLLTLLDALEQILGHEAQALVAGDTDALATHTAAKRAMLRELQGHMNPEFASFAGEDVLLARLHRCHALNQSTGAAINSAMRHNAQVLSMLGHDPGPVAYAPHRASLHGISQGGRSLASA